MIRTLNAENESWELREKFTISRGSKTAAEVISVETHERGVTGRGECVPYARYGENIRTVLNQIKALRAELCVGLWLF